MAKLLKAKPTVNVAFWRVRVKRGSFTNVSFEGLELKAQIPRSTVTKAIRVNPNMRPQSGIRL